MKKIIIGAVTLALTVGASATNFRPVKAGDLYTGYYNLNGGDRIELTGDDATSGNTIEYTLAGDYYGSLSFNTLAVGSEVAIASSIESILVPKFNGSKITQLKVMTPGMDADKVTGTSDNQMTEATIFVSNDLENFEYTQNVTLGAEGFTVQTIDLTTPYEIKGDKAVYFGMYFKTKAKHYYIPVDGQVTLTQGGAYARIPKEDGKGNEWMYINNQAGNVCYTAVIECENKPENGAIIFQPQMPESVSPNEPFKGTVVIRNVLYNKITSVEITATVQGENPVSKTVTSIVNPNGMSYADHGDLAVVETPELICTKMGLGQTITIAVTKVNGQDNIFADNSVETSFDCYDGSTAFDRNIVVEEGTGTWCGYCPAGMVMLESIKERHPDNVFCIAVHGTPNQGDRMSVAGYQQFLSDFISGFPCVVVDRSTTITPTVSNAMQLFENYYEAAIAQKSMFKVEVTADYADEKKRHMAITANVTPMLDINNSSDRYQVSFVYILNGVGPYTQSNYYNGGASGAMGGWEELPAKYSMLYDDVASGIEGYPGVPGSLPTLVANQTVSARADFNIRSVKQTEIPCIAFVVDTKTKKILNAGRYVFQHNSGIENVAADNTDNDAPVEYFNLQGIRVVNPQGGIFIRRQGNEVTKVIM